MESLTIGKLAKQAEISRVTIRYYEKRGLIKTIARTPAKYRLYSPNTIDQLIFIKNAQEVGFTLKEIKSLFDLLNGKAVTSSDIKNRTLSKINDIKEKITTLKFMQDTLEHWTMACDGKVSLEKCPILKNLYQLQTKIRNKKKV